MDDESNAEICRSNFSPYEASNQCFLQTLFNTPFEGFRFVDNHAKIAGNLLFGGLLDRCTISQFSHVHELQDSHFSKTSLTPMNGVKHFQYVTG